LTLYFSKDVLNARPIINVREQKGINVNGSCSHKFMGPWVGIVLVIFGFM
jgi:hypothetical protein